MKTKLLVTVVATLALLGVWVPSASAGAKWSFGNGIHDLAVDVVQAGSLGNGVCNTHITGLAGVNTGTDPASQSPPPPLPTTGFTVKLFTGAPGELAGATVVGGALEVNGVPVPLLKEMTTAPPIRLLPADFYTALGVDYWEYAAASFAFDFPASAAIPAGNDVVILNQGNQAYFNTTAVGCTTTTVESNLNPSVAGQSVKLTAKVTRDDGTPVTTGSVTFTVGPDDLVFGPVNVDSSGEAWTVTSVFSNADDPFNGSGVFYPGNYQVTADYLGGDYDHVGSSTASLTQMVTSDSSDSTPPTFGPCTGGPFSLNSGNQTVSITAADEAGGSGLNASASTLSGSVSTSSVGQKTVTFTATDNQNNTATKTCSYQVAYVFAGFSAPVDNDVVNLAKAGQAVPLKFTVTDGTGASVTNLTTASALAVAYACDAADGTDVLEEYATGNSGLQNLGGGRYQFNFKTLKSWAGSCRTLGIRLADGINHSADFQFKR